MATLAAQIDANGISAPSYADILAQLQNAFWTIYGTDADLDADAQDGQWLAILAQGFSDSNQTCIAVYVSYSPTFAQGAGLSSIVKINGIRRQAPSNSTAPVTLTGTAGTPINDAIIGDNLNLGTQWSVPDVVIDIGGTVDTTATCLTPGAVTAASGSLSEILTPTFGWFGVTSTADATTGAPVEVDATLRQRQSVSTGLPAQTPLAAINAQVANVAGVQRLRTYENDTDTTDSNGLPPHSISIVTQGGATLDICTAIFDKKNPGTGTYGNTSAIIIDENGVPDVINYFPLALVSVSVVIHLTRLSGWSTSTEALIQASVAAFLSGLGIGVPDYLSRLWAPCTLSGDAATNATGLTQAQLDALSLTYDVTAIDQAIIPAGATPADIAIAFNQAAACVAANVTFVVT